SDPALSPRAGARPRARGRALRARVPAAQAWRSGRRGPAPTRVPRASAQRPRRAEMDRARDAGAARPRCLRTHQSRRCRGTLTPQGTRLGRAGGVVLLLMAAVACNKFGPADLSRVIALDVSAPDSLEEYDTLKPHARVLDGHGDAVRRFGLRFAHGRGGGHDQIVEWRRLADSRPRR